MKPFSNLVVEVFINRLINENVVRIAACAAFLVFSLMGKPLHELQHLIGSTDCVHHEHSSAVQAKPKTLGCGQSCKGCLHSSDLNHAEVGSSSPAESHDSGDGHPEHSHDSHDCSVCQTLCVSATSPDRCVAVQRPETCSVLDAIFSESADRSAPQTTDARGPPALA